MVDLTALLRLDKQSVRSSPYCICDVSEVWSSGEKLGHCLWKLLSKRTGQELSGHDDVIHDFHHRLKPSQSSQEDRRLPENAGTKRRSCIFVAAQFQE